MEEFGRSDLYETLYKSSWIKYLGFYKGLFIFSRKSEWHKFERKYIEYWTDIVCASFINSYLKTIKISML